VTRTARLIRARSTWSSSVSTGHSPTQFPRQTTRPSQPTLRNTAPVAPGTGEMGFGYLRPAQVQIEWVKIDRAAVQAAVKVDPLQVQQRIKAKAEPGKEADPVKRALAMTDTLRTEAVATALADASTAARAAILGPSASSTMRLAIRTCPRIGPPNARPPSRSPRRSWPR